MGLLEGRVIAVTGASRGIGYFAALEMAARGAHVIAIARTVGGLEELDDAAQKLPGNLTLVPFDITDYEAIDRLGGEISKRWGRLDGFLANAAILGGLSPLGHVETKTFDKVMAINVTANWRFVRSFDDLFRASDSARLLFMTCSIAKACKAYWGPYAMSKSALEALARTYAAECINTDIRVNLFDPGNVHTALRALAMPGEDKDSLTHPRDPASSIATLMAADAKDTGQIFQYSADSSQIPV